MEVNNTKSKRTGKKATATRSEEIIFALKQSIMTQRFRPGDALPKEEELARQFNVGRPLIREALGVLKSQGYLEARRGNLGGTFVKDLLQSNEMGRLVSDLVMMGHMSVQELVTVRLLIEPEAARMAALYASAVDIQRLEDICDCTKNARKTNERLRCNVEFHNQIAILSGNPFFSLLIRSTMNFTRMFLEMFLREGEDIHDNPAHDKLLEAISSRNSQLAYERMYVHVANLKERMVPLEKSFRTLSQGGVENVV